MNKCYGRDQVRLAGGIEHVITQKLKESKTFAEFSEKFKKKLEELQKNPNSRLIREFKEFIEKSAKILSNEENK